MIEGDFSAAVSVLVDDALFVFAASGTRGSSYALLRVSQSQSRLTQDRITESTITITRKRKILCLVLLALVARYRRIWQSGWRETLGRSIQRLGRPYRRRGRGHGIYGRDPGKA